jgi:hypothetical protein
VHRNEGQRADHPQHQQHLQHSSQNEAHFEAALYYDNQKARQQLTGFL